MNKAITLLVVVISLGVLSVNGADASTVSQPSGPLHKVNIHVVAAEKLKNDIRGNVAGALQSVANVQLVDENPEWTIEIVTLTLQDQEGKPTAVALSVVVMKHGPQMTMLETLTKAWRYVVNAGLLEKDQPLEVGMRELLAAVEAMPKSEPLTVVSQHRMCLIPVQKLGEACRETAVNFSSRFLSEAKVAQAPAEDQADGQVSVASAASESP